MQFAGGNYYFNFMPCFCYSLDDNLDLKTFIQLADDFAFFLSDANSIMDLDARSIPSNQQNEVLSF